MKELGFSIITDNRPLSKMKFRVNIYRKEDDGYKLQNFNPLYFDYDKTKLDNGLFAYKFPEEIMLDEGNYYIELEFLENFTNEYFIMRSKPMTIDMQVSPIGRLCPSEHRYILNMIA